MIILAAAIVSALLTVPRAEAPPSLDGPAGWDNAAASTLDHALSPAGPATEKTAVRVLVDGTYLYVRFDAEQHAAITATQAVDDVGEGSDDEVAVRLWPSGSNGFRYVFAANPRGTHYQQSSENSNYAPTWTSKGTMRPGGFLVTMRIPLAALRGDGRATWGAQFSRVIRTGNQILTWSWGAGMMGAEDVTYAGSIGGLGGVAKAARTKPRIGIYGLAESGTRATGGTTARNGADVSLPLTATSSLVATFHPDFSNVERDQQTIAPTAFRRSVSEVRPFFAQGSGFYDYNDCFGCPGAMELYTPAIPTPKRGFQIEGKQGQFTFGALDAVGDGRIDDAQSLVYTTPSRTWQANYTRVASEQPGMHDVTDWGFISYSDHKRWTAYAEGGAEHGTLVSDGRLAQRYNTGLAYATHDDFVSISAQKVGAQYNPVDGFVAAGDIGGFSAQGSHTFTYAKGPIESWQPSVYYERYAGSDGYGTNLADSSAGLSVFLRTKFSAAASIGNGFYRVPGDPQLHSSNQQGLRVDYLFNTAQQSSLSWNTGRFGEGKLDSWLRQASFRLAKRATITLYGYSTDWRGDDGTRAKQWLQRASASLDLGPRASFVAGVRKLNGSGPAFPFRSPSLNATNVSLGLSARRAHDDLYLVYGDASALVTRPALTLKLVHYVGAEKGT